MDWREMQIMFDVLLQQGDEKYEIEKKPDSHTIFIYLNLGQNRLVKTRYSGLNVKGESFEQTQKRTDDLRTLVKTATISTVVGDPLVDSYLATLPNDYMLAVNEAATIQYVNPLTAQTETKRVGITGSTSDTIERQRSNPYSEHLLRYETAEPLRLFRGLQVELTADPNYSIEEYELTYIKVPNKIGLDSDCELPEHMHEEVVSEAVALFLEAAADPRYNTNRAEVRQQE